MKEAQELRAGHVVKMNNDLYMVMTAVYFKGGRNAAVMRMKMRNLTNGSINENAWKAQDKFDFIPLEKKQMQFLYESDGRYTFMDQETYDQIEFSKEDLGDNVFFLKDEMVIDVSMIEGRPIGIMLPINVDLKIEYTEPGNKGDSSGRCTKPATLETGYQVQVPLFCDIGETIRIDTRSGEYVERVGK